MTSPELCSGYFTAKFLAERGTTPAYLYLFTHTPSQEHLKLLRATHTSEIPFVFGTFSEYGLIRHRVIVEVAWVKVMAESAAIKELPKLGYDDFFAALPPPVQAKQKKS